MMSFKLILLLLSLNALDLYKTTHAVPENNNATDKKKESKAVIELNKDITVNTGLNYDETLAQLNITESSYKPRSRTVTMMDKDSSESKLKNRTSSNENKSVNTTSVGPLKVTKIPTEAGGVLEIKDASKNSTAKINTKISSIKSNETFNNNPSNKIENLNKNSSKTTIKPTPAFSTTTILPNITLISVVNTTATGSSNNSTLSSSPTTSTTTSSSTTTTTTKATTTTTTTTPKLKKPTITYSVPDFPDLEKDNPELNNLLQSSASNKLPSSNGPYAQPSQEFNGSLHRGRDFIIPIVSMIFIIPLVIGILITSYRRFRDCWSTRHYRRMDFLVDGMYND